MGRKLCTGVVLVYAKVLLPTPTKRLLTAAPTVAEEGATMAGVGKRLKVRSSIGVRYSVSFGSINSDQIHVITPIPP